MIGITGKAYQKRSTGTTGMDELDTRGRPPMLGGRPDGGIRY